MQNKVFTSRGSLYGYAAGLIAFSVPAGTLKGLRRLDERSKIKSSNQVALVGTQYNTNLPPTSLLSIKDSERDGGGNLFLFVVPSTMTGFFSSSYFSASKSVAPQTSGTRVSTL